MQSIFNEKSHFFDVEMAQLEPVLVVVFSLIAQSFAPLPLYPLHAPQAGPQKSSQICVLLLQAATLYDLTHVSDIILMTSSCLRHYVGDILTYPTWFKSHFLHLGSIFLFVGMMFL